MSELYHICSFHLFEKVAVGRVSLSRLLCSPQYLISSSAVHRSRASSIKPPPPLKPLQTHHVISPREAWCPLKRPLHRCSMRNVSAIIYNTALLYYFTTLHCNEPHCTALNCTTLLCTALHCTAWHYWTGLHLSGLNYGSLWSASYSHKFSLKN